MSIRNKNSSNTDVKYIKIAVWIGIITTIGLITVLLGHKFANHNKNQKNEILNLNDETTKTEVLEVPQSNIFRYLDIRLKNIPIEKYLSNAFPRYYPIPTKNQSFELPTNNNGIKSLYNGVIQMGRVLNELMSCLIPETSLEFVDFYILATVLTGDYITELLGNLKAIPILLKSLKNQNTNFQRQQQHITSTIFSFVFNIIFNDEVLGRYFRALSTFKEFVMVYLSKEEEPSRQLFVRNNKKHLLLVTKFVNYIIEDMFGFISKYRTWEEIDNREKYRILQKLHSNWPVFVTFNVYNYLVVYFKPIIGENIQQFEHIDDFNNMNNEGNNGNEKEIGYRNKMSEIFSHVNILLEPYFNETRKFKMEKVVGLFYNVYEKMKQLRANLIMFIETDKV